MSRLQGLLAGALLLLASAPAAAQAEVTLTLKDGRHLTGQPTRYDGQTSVLHFRTADGRNMMFAMDELDGVSTYRVNTGILDRDDGEAQLQLANFARDAGLYAHAARHYRYAERADPTLLKRISQDRAVMREMAAEFGMQKAHAAIEAGDPQLAVDWLTLVVQKLPTSTKAPEAIALLDELYMQSHHSRDDHLEERGRELLKGDLQRGKQYYDSMLESNRAGLKAQGNTQSLRLFDKAIGSGEQVLQELDRVAQRRTDEESQRLLAGYRQLVVAQIVETRLNVASLLMVQTSYKQALREVDKALALDPGNAEAVAMRSRIEALNRGHGWW